MLPFFHVCIRKIVIAFYLIFRCRHRQHESFAYSPYFFEVKAKQLSATEMTKPTHTQMLDQEQVGRIGRNKANKASKGSKHEACGVCIFWIEANRIWTFIQRRRHHVG